MRVVLSAPSVMDKIREQGGRLFVWTDTHRCCGGGVTYLLTATQPARGHEFRRVETDGFELFFDPGGRQLPEELHLDLKGLGRKRVEAYWNGCAFAV